MSVTTSRGTTAIRGDRTGRSGRVASGLAIALGCVMFLGGFAWAGLVYRPYTVPTESMRPTVMPGDKVLAQKVSGSQVHRGDVVVFKDPLWGNEPLVKRVVAVGGDVVACCDRQGRLTVDGVPVEETYLQGHGRSAQEAFKATVAKGELFMLGDDRSVSEDSRVHLEDAEGGAVPVGDVKGRVDATAWPLGRMGMLPTTSAFDALPGGGQSPQGPLRWITFLIVAGAALILGGAAYEPVAKALRRRR
ncbi:signal peptidase I [Streptomyces sp. V4-01]|uniref:Signal peptidase I n=1 Tax=Actinacidiphila polyblastidii TaxID=3110430 RepID=A0ABU7P4X7_9ACTN|nr:signal peptidase I [Streptomyces sp. V4-01]